MDPAPPHLQTSSLSLRRERLVFWSPHFSLASDSEPYPTGFPALGLDPFDPISAFLLSTPTVCHEEVHRGSLLTTASADKQRPPPLSPLLDLFHLTSIKSCHCSEVNTRKHHSPTWFGMSLTSMITVQRTWKSSLTDTSTFALSNPTSLSGLDLKLTHGTVEKR